MEIITRKVNKDYIDVTIVQGMTTVNLGFHNESEAQELQEVLENGVCELAEFIKESKEQKARSEEMALADRG